MKIWRWAHNLGNLVFGYRPDRFGNGGSCTQGRLLPAGLDIIYAMTTALESAVDRIPWIVDLDAHVVEPPDVWSSRLPSHFRAAGPHIEYMPGGVPKLEGASYVEAPGTDGPPVAWWCYEDHRASVKRTIAAAGFPAEEVVLRGVTYDEMRPGCWQPKARLEDMSLNGVQAQLCFPNYPRFCGQQFLWGKDRALARLCVEAYNDWMVEEWCGSSGGRLLPLCLIPLWDVDLAVAEVARSVSRCTGFGLQRASHLPGSPEYLLGLLGSVVPALPGDWDRRLHARGFGHEDATDIARRTGCRAGDHSVREQHRRDVRFHVLGCSRTFPAAASCSSRNARSAGSLTCSSGPTTCG